MNTQLYPLRFSPIYKEKLWGGSKLRSILGKDIPSDKTGESWEISGIRESESIVANGSLKGKLLSDLIKEYKGALLGEKVFKEFGNEFPLLFKFIDANDDLSVQVHPDDETAQKRYSLNGKTEMWYICEADMNSQLVAGLKEKSSKEEILKRLEESKVEEILNYEDVKAEDSFYIPSGTVHAICKGILLAEIQQSSDLTYRIYDYNRKDINGQLRKLHIKESLDVINYSGNDECRLIQEDNKTEQLVSCEYFTVNILEVENTIKRDYTGIDSFVVYMCIEGQIEIEYSNQAGIVIFKGESLLLPASLKKVNIKSKFYSKLLEVYI